MRVANGGWFEDDKAEEASALGEAWRCLRSFENERYPSSGFEQDVRAQQRQSTAEKNHKYLALAPLTKCCYYKHPLHVLQLNHCNPFQLGAAPTTNDHLHGAASQT
jgi:hypothetical protein